MTDPTDVVERYLRDTFTADALAAPAADGLAGEAVRQGRAHRRRTALVSSAVAVVLVVVGAAAVQQLPRHETATTPPAASPTPSQGPSLVTSTPALLFRGVAVPVPAAYLDPARIRCGTPVADSAYVLGDGQGNRTCLVLPVPGLTEVVMQDIANIPDVSGAAGTHVLADGRTQIASAVPGDGIWLTVTSPDAARARQLFDGTLVVEAWEGCDVRVGAIPEGSSGSVAPFVQRSTSLGRVCAYRNGWLVSTKLLDAEGIRAVADLITSTRSDATLDCATGPSTTTGWWVTLGTDRFWVPNSGCPRLLGENGGAAWVSEELRSHLWELAPGAGTSD